MIEYPAVRWFSEGRIGVVGGFLASQRRTEAELALCAKDEHRVE